MRTNAALLIAALAAAAVLTSCQSDARSTQGMALTGGDRQRGATAINKYGCASCHTIDRIPGAHGLVGPPLTGIADRQYIGGVLRNYPDNGNDRTESRYENGRCTVVTRKCFPSGEIRADSMIPALPSGE